MQAIFFDAFGTLCEIEDKRNAYMPIIKAWPGGVADAYQNLMTRNCSPADLAHEAGCSKETINEVEKFLAAEIESIRLFPEVITVLERLRQDGLKWAIVSNLATPYAEPLLKLLPFTPDACVWSFAVGYRKPEEDIYRHACQFLNVKPSSVLMVGDSLKNDFETPKRLGMQAKYLDRNKTCKKIPDYISDLTGIFA